jgi:hypothetical protein
MSRKPAPVTTGGTQQMRCTLSFATIRYLDLLTGTGTHGASVPAVMTTLIEQGIRRAMREGFLNKPNAAVSDTQEK